MIVVTISIRELIGITFLALIGIAFLIAWLLDKRKKK